MYYPNIQGPVKRIDMGIHIEMAILEANHQGQVM